MSSAHTTQSLCSERLSSCREGENAEQLREVSGETQCMMPSLSLLVVFSGKLRPAVLLFLFFLFLLFVLFRASIPITLCTWKGFGAV